VRLDVAMLLLQGLVRVASDQLERLVGDGRVEQLLADRATNETWPPARRTAVSASRVGGARESSSARFPHGPDGLQRTRAARSRRQREPLGPTARALEVASALPGRDRAALVRGSRSASEKGTSRSSCGRAAIRPLVDRATEWATALLETCIEDPSSLVRLTLAEECARCWIEPNDRLAGVVSRRSRRARTRRFARRPSRTFPSCTKRAVPLPLPGTRRRSAGRALRRGRDSPASSTRGERGRRAIESALDATAREIGAGGSRGARGSPARAARGRSRLRRDRARARRTTPGRIARASGSAPRARRWRWPRRCSRTPDEDHGFTIEISGAVDRGRPSGDRSRFRLWRALFELRHAGPSKRQGHTTHGRTEEPRDDPRSRRRRCARQRPTGIPGERVQSRRHRGMGIGGPDGRRLRRHASIRAKSSSCRRKGSPRSTRRAGRGRD
jgi:hypothetical protein